MFSRFLNRPIWQWKCGTMQSIEKPSNYYSNHQNSRGVYTSANLEKFHPLASKTSPLGHEFYLHILYEKLPHSQFLTWNSGRIYAPAKYSYGTKYLNPNSSKLTLRISEICIGYNFWNLLTLFCQIHIRSTHMIFYQERNQNLCDKPAICKVLQRYWKNW